MNFSSEFFEDVPEIPKNESHLKFHPNNEGIDHINIYSKSKLLIGKQLSNFYLSPFTIDGESFQSVEGYWYWLKTGKIHDTLKHLSGFMAKEEGRMHPKVECENFNEKIKEAIKLKIESNTEIKENFKNCSLPFTHYYCYGDVRNLKIHDLHKKYEWLIDFFTNYRNELKEKRNHK